MKKGRAGICDHERRVGKEEAETQDPSAESLKEMRMGREIWEQRVMSQSQDNTNMGGGVLGMDRGGHRVSYLPFLPEVLLTCRAGRQFA